MFLMLRVMSSTESLAGPGLGLVITNYHPVRGNWWQLIIMFREFTCDYGQRKEEGRKQEDPPVKTVSLGWPEERAPTPVVQSLHLIRSTDLIRSDSSLPNFPSFFVNVVKTSSLRISEAQLLTDFPSKEHWTTHWVFLCNWWVLEWNFK